MKVYRRKPQVFLSGPLPLEVRCSIHLSDRRYLASTLAYDEKNGLNRLWSRTPGCCARVAGQRHA